jgi:hypothetical protein
MTVGKIPAEAIAIFWENIAHQDVELNIVHPQKHVLGRHGKSIVAD